MAVAEFNNVKKKGIKSIQGAHFTEATNANAKQNIIQAQSFHTYTHSKQALWKVAAIYRKS